MWKFYSIEVIDWFVNYYAKMFFSKIFSNLLRHSILRVKYIVSKILKIIAIKYVAHFQLRISKREDVNTFPNRLFILSSITGLYLNIFNLCEDTCIY